MIGYTDLSQGTVGAQIGGQAYTELLVFETREALDRFRTGKFAFAANASAVAAKSGASASAKFTNGVAVFVGNEEGLMAEAAIGGQQFTFQSNDAANRAESTAGYHEEKRTETNNNGQTESHYEMDRKSSNP